jgi:hypothetical protein
MYNLPAMQGISCEAGPFSRQQEVGDEPSKQCKDTDPVDHIGGMEPYEEYYQCES